jgi:hypothetical protein
MPAAFDYVMPLMGRGLDYQDTVTLLPVTASDWLAIYDDPYTHPKDWARD